MIGAKILLATGVDAAREGLAGLAGNTWMLTLPHGRACRDAHPAGSALPRPPGGGRVESVAVMFGDLAEGDGLAAVLPVRWESLEPGDEFTVLLDADIAVASVCGHDYGVLTLTGVCRLSTSLNSAAGMFISSVADVIGQVSDPLRHGQA